MAVTIKDSAWLRNQLATALGWELSVAEGVAEAIAAANSQAEVDELVQDYMGGNERAANIVRAFASQREPADAQGETAQQTHSRRTQAAQAARMTPRGAPVVTGQRQGGSVTVVHRPARKAKSAQQQGPQFEVEKEVVNCLRCGKIFHPFVDSPDAKHLVDSGGTCSFCGAHVALSLKDKSEERPPAAERGAAAGTSGPKPPAETPEAFKDRMVGYDRDSAKRTQVLDDQSDWFDVDSNTWLSAEEREQLKAQEAAIWEAEEARRKRVTVHIDLLGRQVLMADEASTSDERPDTGMTPPGSEAAAAAAATGRERPQGGGTGAAAASAAAAHAAGLPAVGGPLVFRDMPNLSLRMPAPMFIRPTPQSDAADGGASSGKRQASTKFSLEDGPVLQHAAAGRSSMRHPRRPPRLQHDEPFEVSDMQLAVEA